jgi:Mg2+-importing ATPase
VGASALTAVVLASLHVSEGREFVRLVQRASPEWFVLALLLQVATYLAQAEVFGGVPRAAGTTIPRGLLCQLSLTKLFLDQALPPAGVSSTAVVAQALEGRGVPRSTVAAGAIVNIVSYQVAYVVALVAALVIAAGALRTSVAILLLSALLVGLLMAITVAMLALSGRPTRPGKGIGRLSLVREVVGFLGDADSGLARSPGLLAQATAWQVAIFLLDTATMWALIRSLGATAPATMVFASSMISTLVRTLGLVPGGLGAFEATSVATLHLVGVSVPVALSATLIFRGLSFWLPMLPGLWFSRLVTRRRGKEGGPATRDGATKQKPEMNWLTPDTRGDRPPGSEPRGTPGAPGMVNPPTEPTPRPAWGGREGEDSAYEGKKRRSESRHRAGRLVGRHSGQET